MFDQFGTLIPNATIVAASGFDYFAPVPEPSRVVLAGTGLLLLLTQRKGAACYARIAGRRFARTTSEASAGKRSSRLP